MKKAISSFALFLTSFIAFAQDGPLTKGSVKLNLSYGLGSYIKIAGGETTFAPLTGSVEYAINENTTLGPVVGYTATAQRYYYPSLGINYTYKFSNLLIGAKGNHYFNTGEKFEAYLGAFLGYNVVSATLESSSGSEDFNYPVEDAGGFLYGFQAGGRYKLSSNLAAHAELGYGIAVLNIGLTFSIPKK